MRRREKWEIWKLLKWITTSHLIDEMRWDGLAGHGRYKGRSHFKRHVRKIVQLMEITRGKNYLKFCTSEFCRISTAFCSRNSFTENELFEWSITKIAFLVYSRFFAIFQSVISLKFIAKKISDVLCLIEIIT